MNNKVLKSSTIVPSHLYVDRDADRQVEKVLCEMGRPGYVLVARQMGKTNLLLNAKRKFETKDDVFVYIDLSNVYKTSRECFRSFIDTALETHWDIFKPIMATIYEKRKHDEIEPHQEHLRELRYLLRTISGKLVYILDEVDALTKTDYSDEIFAQIRSVYFSRINFNEAERLTYLLSGVAEPTELIKNKNISPFNIGQKIYLEDFSVDEYKSFLAKTGLAITNDVVERIYHWSGGNPRMTWEICSEIEDLAVDGNIVGIELVDHVVNLLYLSAFDRPPVDHIRSIVEKDKDIRNAITEIRYNKGQTLSDATKNKLYLAGIISGYVNGTDVKIKNAVIEYALSQKYLNSVEVAKKGTLIVGIERYVEGNYSEALQNFKTYLSDNPSLTAESKSEIFFKMGNSSYALNNLNEAKQYLVECLSNLKHNPCDTYYDANYILGICNMYLNDYASAINCLDQVVDANRKDKLYLKSLLALASAKQVMGLSLNQCKELYYKVIYDIESQYSADNNNESYSELISTARHNLGYIFIQEGDNFAAHETFKDAMVNCPDKYKPKLLLGEIKVAGSIDDKIKIIKYFVELIPKIKVNSDRSPHIRTLDLDVETFHAFMVSAIEIEQKDLYKLLLNSFVESAHGDDCDEVSTILALANYALKQKKPQLARVLCEEVILHLPKTATSANTYKASKTLLILHLSENGASGTTAHIDEHVEQLYCSSAVSPEIATLLDNRDIQITAFLIFKYLNQFEKADRVTSLISICDAAVQKMGQTFEINNSWINFVKMYLEDLAGNSDSALEYAKKALQYKSVISQGQTNGSVLTDKQLDQLISSTRSRVKQASMKHIKVSSTPLCNGRKYGRNEPVKVRYDDGRELTVKYKKVSDDIEHGRCQII